MQTFLPYPDFSKSAACLDRLRLGKQRVECVQILNALRGASRGWVNHPATRMWRGYEPALCNYTRMCIVEWVARGYKNTMPMQPLFENAEMPPWFGNPDFHASHRSNLLRKDFEFYSKMGWTEPSTLAYIWPVA